ncbi:hypothetical protein RICGR_0741 [Rickettsiella grylli]|uniref:Uncharacterized protein n=1 Tax=Rickettsiella grylli TaxID=59196 RepID=A8PMI5_9COXI|nr:hypothetical protein RICGR_0741 [Rickettsiella grylli]
MNWGAKSINIDPPENLIYPLMNSMDIIINKWAIVCDKVNWLWDKY